MEHPMVLYKRFRGQEPTIDAFINQKRDKKLIISIKEIDDEKYK